MDSTSQRRLAENEVIFRKANQDVQKFITDTENGRASLRFYCECSHADCRERITMSVKDYQRLHSNKREFIVLEGHEIPEIEKVVSKEKGCNVIEKYGDPPSENEIQVALKNINSSI